MVWESDCPKRTVDIWVINKGHLNLGADERASLKSDDIDGEDQNDEPPPSSSPAPAYDDASDQSHDSEESTNETSDSSQPSGYLHQRCPLCFGGENPHDPSFL